MTILLLLIVGTIGVLVSGKSVRVELGPVIQITQLHTGEKISSIGVVQGTRSCGGYGKLLEWRYESCKPHVVPCQAPSDGSLKIAEVDFIPSKDISSVGLRLTVTSVDGEINKQYNFDGSILNAAVRRGEAYTIRNAGGVTNELKGKLATFQYIIYDKMSNEVEVCAESMFQYV